MFFSKFRFLVFIFILSFSSLAQTKKDILNSIKKRKARLSIVKPVYDVARTEPGQIGETVRFAKKNQKKLIFNTEKDLPASVRESRLVISSLFKDQTTRTIAVNLMNQKILNLSNQLKVELSSQTLKVNQVIIGAGPQGVAYAQELTNKNPNATSLIVDRASKPGGTFANVFNAFYINSTNRKYDGTRARPGQGDLNNFTDIVGVPDFKGRRWFEAGLLGQVASAGTLLSSSNPLLETSVVSVKKNPNANPLIGEPRYIVTLKDVKSKENYIVKTDNIITTTGIGEAREFGDSSETRDLIAQEKRDAKREKRAPRVESFFEYVDRVADPKNQTPLAEVRGKNIAVVGGGDSGRVINEFLTGVGPEKAYKQSVAQEGNIGKIYWFVGTGKNTFKTCAEYIAKTRARYAQISQAINSGVLVPVPGNLNDFVKTRNGKYVVTKYTSAFDSGAKITDQNSSGVEIEIVIPKDLRKGIKEEKTVEQKIVFEKLIYATGTRSKIAEIFKTLTDKPFSESWKLVSGQVKEFGRRKINIAREHKTAPGVYLAGSANESFGGLPKKAELAGVNDNTVSLFANTTRTKALTNNTPNLANYNKNGKDVLGRINRPKTLQLTVLTGTENDSIIEVSVDKSQFEKVQRVANAEFAFRTAFAASLKSDFNKVKINGPRYINEIKFVFSNLGKGKYEVRLSGVVDQQSRTALETSLRNNILLNNVLIKDYFTSKNNGIEIEVKIPIVDYKAKVERMYTTVKRTRIRR